MIRLKNVWIVVEDCLKGKINLGNYIQRKTKGPSPFSFKCRNRIANGPLSNLASIATLKISPDKRRYESNFAKMMGQTYQMELFKE